MEVSRNYETECETSHNYRNFLQYCNQEINVSANKRTQTPRCMARILVTNIPIKWWQNLPGAVKRSHEVFGMDGEDGFITSLYRRESRRPQQGSLGHIIQWWFKIDEIVLVLLDCHWVPRNSNLFEILRVVYYYYYYYNLGNGGVPVHQDPVHGIVANREKWQWGPPPFSIFGVCDNPVHRVMVNWDPLIPAGWEAGPTITDITERGLLYLAVHNSQKTYI